MLIERHVPLEHRCRTLGSLAGLVLAGASILIAAGLRLGAVSAEPDDEPQVTINAGPEPEAPPKAATEPAADGSLTYSGKVVEKNTGKPVAGAMVVVKRSVFFRIAAGRRPRTRPDPAHHGCRRSVHLLDSRGTGCREESLSRYQRGAPGLRRPCPSRDTRRATVRADERKGFRPFFAEVAVRPCAPISGRVLTPGGEPAAGVEVLAWSRSEQLKPGDQDYAYGPFSHVTTGQDGRFTLTVTTPGVAIFWIMPKQFAPEDHLLVDGRRGDLGTFRLKAGITVKGRVVDAAGRPLAGFLVEATRDMNCAGAGRLPPARRGRPAPAQGGDRHGGALHSRSAPGRFLRNPADCLRGPLPDTRHPAPAPRSLSTPEAGAPRGPGRCRRRVSRSGAPGR